MIAARVTLAVVAVAALAWLAIMERDQRLLARATAASGHIASPAGEAAVLGDLRAARFLNPDAMPDITRGFVYSGNHQPDRALAVTLAVARREPDNVVAWGALAVYARGRNPAVEREARVRLRTLDPLDARRR